MSGEWQEYESVVTETLEFEVTVAGGASGSIAVACQDEFGQTGALAITPDVEEPE